MPHVELSLVDQRRLPLRRSPVTGQPGGAEPPDSPPRRNPAGAAAETIGSLQRWSAAVAAAAEPCLVLDADSVILASSPGCADLLGCGDPASARGRRLPDAVVNLVDFTDPPDKLDRAEADKIPPLLAISSGRLARGLIRVARPDQQRAIIVDAVATPLWEDRAVVGSLTFFSRV